MISNTGDDLRDRCEEGYEAAAEGHEAAAEELHARARGDADVHFPKRSIFQRWF